MQSKPFYQSKTIVGAVMMLIALVLQIYQIELPQEQVDAAGANLAQTLQGIAGFWGFLLVIWGRIKADRPLGISG